MSIVILHTNDMHGTLGRENAKFRALLQMRGGADLYFDSGDAIKAGNLAVPIKPELAWTLLRDLRCTASVLGNRETHPIEAAFQAKLRGSGHPILCANLKKKDGTYPLPRFSMIESNGVKVGIFGVMVPMVTSTMKTAFASSFLWEDPFETSEKMVFMLSKTVDMVVCLSHLGYRQDQKLAETVRGINVIFGGHSHTVLQTPERIGPTWICQGGSYSKFAGLYEWHPESRELTGKLVEL